MTPPAGAPEQSHPHEVPGLQPERSALAWTRTAIALLASSALILTQDVGDIRVLIPGMLGLAIAAATMVISQRRKAVLRRRPLPAPLAAGTSVHLIGWSVAALGVLTLTFLILPDSVGR